MALEAVVLALIWAHHWRKIVEERYDGHDLQAADRTMVYDAYMLRAGILGWERRWL